MKGEAHVKTLNKKYGVCVVNWLIAGPRCLLPTYTWHSERLTSWERYRAVAQLSLFRRTGTLFFSLLLSYLQSVMHGDLRHVSAFDRSLHSNRARTYKSWKISNDMHTIRLNISDNFHRDDAWKSDINLCCRPSDSQRSSTWVDAERMNNLLTLHNIFLCKIRKIYASTPLSQLDRRLCRVVAGSITCVVFLFFLIQFRLFMVAGRATFNAWDYVKWNDYRAVRFNTHKTFTRVALRWH